MRCVWRLRALGAVGLEMSGNGGGRFYGDKDMKAIFSTLLLALCINLGSLSLVQDASAQAGAPLDQEAYVLAQKPSFFSRFRSRQVPQQQAAEVGTAPKRGFGIRMPRFKKPDLSRIPKPRMPKMSFPKLRKPNVIMPKMRWPFKRPQVPRQTIQNYPNGVRNFKLGGAYGVIADDTVKFYEIGPSQPSGPDATLNRGTLVTIRSNDRAWAYAGTPRNFIVSYDVGGDGAVEFTTPLIDQNNIAAASKELSGDISWATRYVYTADQHGKIRITIDSKGSGSYHLYALTNEEL